MEETLIREYSWPQILLNDQRDSLRTRSATDVVELVCRDRRIIKVHKLLLSAHSPLLKDILASNESAQIVLADFDVGVVEKFCRLLYQGYTLVAASEIEDAKKIAACLNFENPKVCDATQERIVGSQVLKLEEIKETTVIIPDVNEEENVVPTPTVQQEPDPVIPENLEQGPSPPVRSNKRSRKRKSRRERNEKSNLSVNTPGVQQDVNKSGHKSDISSSSDGDEDGSKNVPKKKKKGRYEQECNEEYAVEDLSIESTNEVEGSQSIIESESDSDVPKRRIRTRRQSSLSQQSEVRGRGRCRSGGSNRSTNQMNLRPITTAVRYSFGSRPTETEEEDAVCYFCAKKFSEQGLSYHLNDPQVECGNHIAGKFSFETRRCGHCKKSFEELTHWGYIKHVHFCVNTKQTAGSGTNSKPAGGGSQNVLPQKSKDKDTPEQVPQPDKGKANPQNELSSESHQSQISTSQNISANNGPTEKETQVNESNDDDIDSLSSIISADIVEVDELNVHYTPLNKLLTLREEARQKQQQKVREVKDIPSQSQESLAMAQSACGMVTATKGTEYVIKSRPGGPGPASKTGRRKMTLVGQPSQDGKEVGQIVAPEIVAVNGAPSDLTTLLIESEISEKPTSTVHVEPQATTNAKLGKIRELFRCSVCNDEFNHVHQATKCCWNKGMQLCWICHAVFLIGEKSSTFEQFEYCNPRFRLHCAEAEHTFKFGGKTVVCCPHCGELVPVEVIHDHIESIHVRDYEIDKEVKKANRARARDAKANANTAATMSVVDQGMLTDNGEKDSEEVLLYLNQIPARLAGPQGSATAGLTVIPTPQNNASPQLINMESENINRGPTSVDLSKSGSSTASIPTTLKERFKLVYNTSKLRDTIELAIQQIRDRSRNATLDKVLIHVRRHYLAEQDQSKAQSPNPTNTNQGEPYRPYAEIEQEQIAALLDEMTKDGILKCSDKKKAYRRVHRPDGSHKWTEKKLRKLAIQALTDLSALDSSEGFGIDIIENHISHAFSLKPLPPELGESLSQMLGRVLGQEISNGTVELVHGNLYRLPEESDTATADLVFDPTQQGAINSSVRGNPETTVVASPILNQNLNHGQNQKLPTTVNLTAEPKELSRKSEFASQSQQTSKATTDTPVTTSVQGQAVEKTTPLTRPLPASIVSARKPLFTIPKKIASRPKSSETTQVITTNSSAQVLESQPYPSCLTSTPTPDAPAPKPDMNIKTPVTSSGEPSSTNQPAAPSGMENQKADMPGPGQSGISVPYIPIPVTGNKAGTDENKSKCNKLDGNEASSEDRSRRSQKIANRLFKAFTKPTGPSLQAAAPVLQERPVETVPLVQSREPIAHSSHLPAEPARTSSAAAHTPLSTEPTVARAPSPLEEPAESTIVVLENDTSYCSECKMTYEDANAAMYHICL